MKNSCLRILFMTLTVLPGLARGGEDSHGNLSDRPITAMETAGAKDDPAVIHEQASKLTKQDISDLERKAEEGDADAQNLLGEAFEFGYGTKEKDSEAVKWYQRSADQGIAFGQYSLCNSYQYGHGVHKDRGTAMEWCHKAADQGLADAQAKLGYLFIQQRDYPSAAMWTRKAAEQGDFDARMNMAAMFSAGAGVPVDHESAYMWILLARVARCGQPAVKCIEKDPELDATTKKISEREAATLSAEQISEANRRVHEFLETHQMQPLTAIPEAFPAQTQSQTTSSPQEHAGAGAIVENVTQGTSRLMKNACLSLL
jgi:hypothetical protein